LIVKAKRGLDVNADGDFDELVKRLVREEKLRIVFAPCRDGCSKLLTKVAIDKIAFIDDFRDALEKIRRVLTGI
jgi:hypothetical protein